MKVINIAVDKLDVFIDQLLRYLIKYEIGYVNIDNHEIHIDNTIYRFYPFDTDEKSEITVNKVILLQDLNFNNFLNSSPRRIIKNENISFTLSDKELFNDDRSFSYLNKNNIKQNNKIINQKIKSRKKQYNYKRRKTF